MEQRIGFFYLSAGGGHRSASRALSSEIALQQKGSLNCFQYDPLEKVEGPALLCIKKVLEQGYSTVSNKFIGGWLLTYQLTNNRFVFRAIMRLLSPFLVPRLVKFLKTHNITKAVCLIGILGPLLHEAILRVNPSIAMITCVLDPFTAHLYWFAEKNTELIVFSQKLKSEAISLYGFDPKRVHVFPLLLSKKFDVPYSDDEKRTVRERLGIEQNEKIILIAGGGEGIKNAPQLVRAFIRLQLPYRLLVVCGRNAAHQKRINAMVNKYQAQKITVYGFIDFMSDVMNIADCVITKGGPATVMETLSVQKPLILSDYIRGQELGNVLYVTTNEVGYFLPDANQAMAKAGAILEDESLQKDIKARIAALNITNGLTAVADYIVAH